MPSVSTLETLWPTPTYHLIPSASKKNMTISKHIKNLLYLWAVLWAWAAMIPLALSKPLHPDHQQHSTSLHNPSGDMTLAPRVLSPTTIAHDNTDIRKRHATPGPKRAKSKKTSKARSPPSHPNISSASKHVRANSPDTNVRHAKGAETTTITQATMPHKVSMKKADLPVMAASDSNNHTNVTGIPIANPPAIREPPPDPKIIVLAIVGSLCGLACCFYCLLGASRRCCFLHRTGKKDDVVFETVSIGGKKIGAPMPVEDMDDEEAKETGTTIPPPKLTGGSKSERVAFTEFWNVPETSKDGKRGSKGQKTKGRFSLYGSAAKTMPAAHHITSPIESIPPQQYDRAESPTIYYNPEFAFSNKNTAGVYLPPPPAPVAVQTCTDPLKSKRMPQSSPKPMSNASESFLSSISSVSVFRLSDLSDTHPQQLSQKRPGPKPHPINTSQTWPASVSSSTHTPTTPFLGSGLVSGDEGYFSAAQVALSPVRPSPVYPPYPPGAACHVTHQQQQQQPGGFDQAQYQHQIQTPYQQYRGGNQEGRYYY